MGKKSTNIPPPDPRMIAAFERQVGIGENIFAFAQQAYADNQSRLDKNDALNERVINQNLDLSAKAGQRADDAYNYYTTTGRPVVTQALNDAKNYDSAEEITKARDRAQASFQQSADNAERQNVRMLTRMGVNPNSGRFAALNNQMQLQKAAGLAGAVNSAEEGRRSGAIAMRQQASNLAQGMPATSMGFAGQSAGFGTGAAGVGAQGLSGALSVQNAAVGGMGAGGNMVGSGGQGFNSVYGNQLQGASIAANQASSNAAGWGQLAGIGLSMLKAGGTVGVDGRVSSNQMGQGGLLKGPGTGTSDSIDAINQSTGEPVKLSNGEYIIPKRVVDQKGREFFDRMISKYSNLGRA